MAVPAAEACGFTFARLSAQGNRGRFWITILFILFILSHNYGPANRIPARSAISRFQVVMSSRQN
jgi:hypothetical protein